MVTRAALQLSLTTPANAAHAAVRLQRLSHLSRQVNTKPILRTTARCAISLTLYTLHLPSIINRYLRSHLSPSLRATTVFFQAIEFQVALVVLHEIANFRFPR